MRGTEGETVANARRAQQIDWFHDTQRVLLVEKQRVAEELADLPEGRDAPATAAWLKAVLAGQRQVPEAIQEQLEHCTRVAAQIGGR